MTLQQMPQQHITGIPIDDRSRGHLTESSSPEFTGRQGKKPTVVPNAVSGGLWGKPLVLGAGGEYTSSFDIWRSDL